MNQVFVDGYVVDEPKIKTQESGSSVVMLTISNKRYAGKNANGEREYKQSYFYAKAFGYVAKWCMEVRKGDRIVVRGPLAQETWMDRDGNKRSAVMIYIDELNQLERRNGGETEY